MYFKAILPDNLGISFSWVFTVVPTNDPEAIIAAETNDDFFKDTPYHKDILPPGSSNHVNPNLTTPDDLNRDVFTSEPSSGQGGLPSGAIAGIAVGCVVAGLAFIGLLVWLFLRQRRRQKTENMTAMNQFGNGRVRTDELMAEKEANAGVDASPHSPYSDDGGAIGAGAGGVCPPRESGSLHHVSSAAPFVAGHNQIPHHHQQQQQQQLRRHRSITTASQS